MELERKRSSQVGCGLPEAPHQRAGGAVELQDLTGGQEEITSGGMKIDVDRGPQLRRLAEAPQESASGAVELLHRVVQHEQVMRRRVESGLHGIRQVRRGLPERPHERPAITIVLADAAVGSIHRREDVAGSGVYGQTTDELAFGLAKEAEKLPALGVENLHPEVTHQKPVRRVDGCSRKKHERE